MDDKRQADWPDLRQVSARDTQVKRNRTMGRENNRADPQNARLRVVLLIFERGVSTVRAMIREFSSNKYFLAAETIYLIKDSIDRPI
jgi:hypothetical protein